ncbi:endonuclease/exonuclease/phosphatase family protein [Actinoplanes sp. NPDC026623]|uniref:endonuclease/exonuclease/phosphatase family protein n=1 Tax=Actinoplanes sp. NPDC026623 TaxID=3155610 RepID=UPI0033CDB7BE
MRIAVALAALICGLLAGAAPARAQEPVVNVVTFNVCGNVCRHGEVTRTAQNVARQVRDRHASVAMLQELCYSQFLRVRALLAPHGYSAVFAPATTGGQCDDRDRRHGRGFGVAIVARGTLSGRVVRQLPSPYETRPEPRVALGARVHLAGRSVLVVTTHTAPRGPNLALQLAAIQRWLVPIAAGRPVIFGGDLNSLPTSPDLAGFGAEFQEADRRPEPLTTFIPAPRKIDHLFASQRFLAPHGTSTVCGAYSDHCLYLAGFVTR